jgi:hypothetical protein
MEVFCNGEGTKRNAHRYHRPGMEMKWQDRAVERLNKLLGLGGGKEE